MNERISENVDRWLLYFVQNFINRILWFLFKQSSFMWIFEVFLQIAIHLNVSFEFFLSIISVFLYFFNLKFQRSNRLLFTSLTFIECFLLCCLQFLQFFFEVWRILWHFFSMFPLFIRKITLQCIDTLFQCFNFTFVDVWCVSVIITLLGCFLFNMFKLHFCFSELTLEHSYFILSFAFKLFEMLLKLWFL
jgi:hypothetical protein